jgi:hypothetical protein
VQIRQPEPGSLEQGDSSLSFYDAAVSFTPAEG